MGEIMTPPEVRITDSTTLFKDNHILADLFLDAVTEYTVNPENGHLLIDGHEYADTPRVKTFIRVANRVRASLPPVARGHVRLWRGNRPDELGKNPSFTNSLEGIALPFLIRYQGKLSFVDIPEESAKAAMLTGIVAKNSEFNLPPELAATAQAIDEDTMPYPNEALALAQQYIDSGGKLNKESIVAWLTLWKNSQNKK